MGKRMAWLVVSCLMVAALVLSSCAPAVTEKEEVVTPPTEKEKEVVVKPPTEEKEVVEEKAEMVKVRLTKLDGTVVEKMLEKPKYGGTITTAWDMDPASFDPIDAQGSTGSLITSYAYEKLQIGDITRGPLGTNEYSFTHWSYIPMNMKIGHLAESWERLDPLTYVWHIRKGIHWQNIPPVSGREMTAEDVAYSILRQKSGPRIATNFFGGIESVKTTDKYTVVVKLKWPDMLFAETTGEGWWCPVYAKEMVDKYGSLNEPRSCCGTGPWMVADYIRGSVLIYDRNPNYWKNDPFFPENTLPYADGVRVLIIPDISTRIAGLRTGKIDYIYQHKYWTDAESVKKTNPEINQIAYVAANGVISIMFRVDKPPFNDIRVRQALILAINQEAMLRDYLRGLGELHNYPEMRDWGEEVWTPIEKLPTEPTIPGSRCGVRELYEYKPEKAKQLLAEAGYPSGFQTDIILLATQVDVTSLVAAYWKDIGVDLKLSVKDPAVQSMISTKKPRDYAEGMMVQNVNAISPTGIWWSEYITLGNYNVGNIADAHIDQTYLDMFAEPDQAKRDKLCKDLSLYALEQAYKIVGPHPYIYNFWQPWLKNCEGVSGLGYRGPGIPFAYYWVDQDLKAEMTGK